MERLYVKWKWTSHREGPYLTAPYPTASAVCSSSSSVHSLALPGFDKQPYVKMD